MTRDEQLLARVKARAKSFFDGARGSHGWDHVERVARLCRRLGPPEGCDMTVLMAAALLHDIGRKRCDELGGAACHAEEGGRLAEEVLRGAGADEGFIERVVHCVATHRFRNGARPDSAEARVLFDADKLDAIGAVGIGRAFQFAGEVGARLHDPGVDPGATEPYSVDDTAYREYLVKLRHLKDRMLTETGRAMAQRRHAFMERFFEELNDETRGEK